MTPSTDTNSETTSLRMLAPSSAVAPFYRTGTVFRIERWIIMGRCTNGQCAVACAWDSPVSPSSAARSSLRDAMPSLA